MKAFMLIVTLLACAPGAVAAENAAPPAPAAKRSAGRPAQPLRLVPAQLPRAQRPLLPGGSAPEHALAPEPIALPPGVPEQFSPPQEAYAAFPQSSPVPPLKPSACQVRLAKLATFKPLPILPGAGECGAVDAVELDGVMLDDQSMVEISPPATLRCTMAEAVTRWLREDVAPAALKLGAPLRGVDNFDSYECRGRNRVRGATLSEHGRANALDIRGLRLANGATVGLTDANVAKDWREAVRGSACARFSTVLGPGSDGNHEEHIHVDLAERHNGYKTCEWDVREAPKPAQPAAENAAEPTAALPEPVPLPRPRPAAADTSDDGRSKKAKKARS